MSERNALLSISGLSIRATTKQGASTIVDNVDLTVNRGEIVGLIGESGAGKSTLGLASAGFVKPGCEIVSGKIVFDGQNLRELGPQQVRSVRGVKIAYVAQSASASFNPSFKLMEQCTETAIQHGVLSMVDAKVRAEGLFTEMMLPDPHIIGMRYPHQVSGGQLQRAMTAMAMICRPSLIIFDEPTTALDVTTQVGVLAAIRAVVEHYQTSAIYVTHDLAVVAQMANRIMVMRHGKVVEEAPTRRMLSAPEKDYTKSLWALKNFSVDERPRPTGSPLLEVVNVSAKYHSFKVIDEVSFSIPTARTVAIVGESGSGKSTMARVITGLLPRSSGALRFAGVDLSAKLADRSSNQLHSIQLIQQNPDTALNPKQRVGDIVGRSLTLNFGLRGDAKRKRVLELLEMLELDGTTFYHRLPHELSGGQKQRVCIAAALAASPKLLICDEITSALDKVVAEGILKTLVRIQKEIGVSYIIITHDIGLVEAIADEVVILKSGRVVDSGQKSKVLSPPLAEYTKLLLDSTPQMDPDWLTNVLKKRLAVELKELTK